jgi:hypothetical protein
VQPAEEEAAAVEDKSVEEQKAEDKAQDKVRPVTQTAARLGRNDADMHEQWAVQSVSIVWCQLPGFASALMCEMRSRV